MTDKLSPGDAKWVADARRDFIKRVSKTVGSDHERLTDETAEHIALNEHGVYGGLEVSMATELIALRAERVKLESQIRQHRGQISRLQDTVMKFKGDTPEAAAQPAESGSTEVNLEPGWLLRDVRKAAARLDPGASAEDWGKIASDVMVEMECAVDGGEEVRILASALATAAGAKP